MLQMHPDLVGPPGVELQPEKIDHLEPGHHGGVGPGQPAIRGYAHPFPVALAPGDRRIDADRGGVEMAPGQCRIGTMYPARGDGGTEPPVSQVSFGNDHETGGVPVQPMNDPRPPRGPAGQGRAPSDQRVDEGVVPMARGRVDNQTGGLVDDGEFLVFEDEAERNSGGLKGARRFVIGNQNGYDLSPQEEPGSARGFSVHRNPFVRHQTGGLGPGDRHLVGEKPVEAFGFQTENGELDFASGTGIGPGL